MIILKRKSSKFMNIFFTVYTIKKPEYEIQNTAVQLCSFRQGRMSRAQRSSQLALLVHYLCWPADVCASACCSPRRLAHSCPTSATSLLYICFTACIEYVMIIYIHIVLILHTLLFVFVCYSKQSDVIKPLFTVSLYLEILSNSLLQAQTFEKQRENNSRSNSSLCP